MSTSNDEYVLVTEYFHPDSASTGQLMTDLAVGLQRRGLDMTVYTGQPNYHSGENERLPRVSKHEGVLVKRTPVPQVRQSSLPRRLFNWIGFTLSVALMLLLDGKRANRQVIFVSNPPFLPLVTWLVCRLRGWPYTYIVYDVYPDMAIEPGHLDRNGLVATAWSAWHRHVFRDAEQIVVLGPAMRDKIARMAGEGFDTGKIEIIHNWEDEEFVSPMPKEENPFARKHGSVEDFTVLYSGNIGDNHDLETVVRSATAFRDEPVRHLVIGEGDKKDRIERLARELGVEGETVTFLPYQDLDTLPYSLTSGDISVVTVSEGMKGVCVSSKLYTAMAAGRPVLVIAQSDDDESRIVTAYDAGMQVAQGDVRGVVDAIDEWRSDPELLEEQGRNAREALEEHFTESQCIDDYYRLLAGEPVTSRWEPTAQ
jgi:glycosyltransferase involved in cell wall biosynthesis